jgi:alkaline phosphatase D
MERLPGDEELETTGDSDDMDGIFASTANSHSQNGRLWIAVLAVFSVALSLDVILSMSYIFIDKPPMLLAHESAPKISSKLNNALLPRWKALPEPTQIITKVAFGSCLSQEMPQPYWDTVTKFAPDIFILAGDNVYGDCDEPSCQNLRQAYKEMSEHVSVQGAAPALSVYATLDDHDYGSSDCHGTNPYKETARELFAEFFDIPWSEFADKDGVYRSRIWGAESSKQRVQIILLDTRYDRSPFKETRIPSSPYRPSYNNNSTDSATSAPLRMLSEKQWQWLHEQIRQPADLRLLVSSVQVLNDGTGFEAWRQLPAERDRLLKLIEGQSVVILSGDRHVGGFYESGQFMEVTASSLTHTVPLGFAFNSHCFTAAECDEVDPRRVGDGIRENHFGSIEIDWTSRQFTLALRRSETSFGSSYLNSSARHEKRGDAGTVIVAKTHTFPF